MLMHRKKSFGFTLIELLISLVISLIVLGGIIALFSMAVTHSRKTIETGRLDKTLHGVLDSMTRDIHRAGYWSQAETSSTNPFMITGSTDITVNATNNCILLTYDANGDGVLPAISASIDDERYGYRLTGTAVQYRPRGAPFSCAASSSSWTDLTDPSTISITQFSVTLNTGTVTVGTSSMSVRNVTLSITGELVGDSTVSKTITKRVKVYNDKYNP